MTNKKILAKMRRLQRCGFTLKEIGDEFSLSRESVRRALNGHKQMPVGRIERKRRRQELCKAYSMGGCQLSVAKQFGVSQQLVAKAWKEDSTPAQRKRRKRYEERRKG